jgi:Super-infection exclusion protein B
MGISQIIEFLKILLPRISLVALALAFIIVFFLFMTDNVLDFVSVLHFRNANRAWIGATLIASSGVLLALFCLYMPRPLQRYFEKRRNRRQKQKRLHNLSLEEQAVLQKYIRNQTRTQILALEDGVVQGLVRVGILYRSSTVGYQGRQMMFAHNMDDWAWDYLNKHPNLVGLGSSSSKHQERGQGEECS